MNILYVLILGHFLNASPRLDALSQQKQAELNLNWKDCIQLAQQNSVKNSDMRAWILVSGMRCSRKLPSPQSLSAIKKFFKLVESDQTLFDLPIQRKWVLDEYIRVWLYLLNSSGLHAPKDISYMGEQVFEVAKLIDRHEPDIDSSLREKWVSETTLWIRKVIPKYEVGFLTRFQKQKQKARILQLLQIEVSQPPGQSLTPAVGSKELVAASLSEEEKLYQRWISAVQTKDELTVYIEGTELLISYPQGKFNKVVFEKIVELSVDPSANSKSADILSRLDSDRWSELLRQVFRKGSYVNAARLWETGNSNVTGKKDYLKYVIPAARALVITGQYARVLSALQPVISSYRYSEDWSEAVFVLALAHIRLQNWDQAIAQFENLLKEPEAEKYWVPSYYWMIRCMEEVKSPRLETVKKEFLAKFPYTYYALALNLEMNQGNLKLADSSSTDRTDEFLDQVSWTPAKIKRMKHIYDAGWRGELYAEVKSISAPFASNIWVQRVADIGLFPLAIRSFQDLPETQRSLSALKATFPIDIYKNEVENPSKEYNLSKYIVLGLIRQESAFDPWAVSVSNAMGLMQLIPSTGNEVAQQLGVKNFDVDIDLFIPRTNVRMGSYYFSRVLQKFNKYIPYAIASYNAGPERVNQFLTAKGMLNGSSAVWPKSGPWEDLWMDEFPLSETSFYVKAVLRNAILFQYFYGENKWSNPLWSSWLQ